MGKFTVGVDSGLVSIVGVGFVGLEGLEGLLLLRGLLGCASVTSGDIELVADLGPGVASRTRIGHTRVAGKLLVVDLFQRVSCMGLDGISGQTYLGWARLERLHGPGQHLHLTFRERVATAGSSSSGGASVIA